MSTPLLVDQSITQRRAARTTAVYIHRPDRTTSVRTTRACRRTSLCNLRAHSFAPPAATPNRNEQLRMYKNCVILAAHNASQSRAPMPQRFRRFTGKTCMDGGVVKLHLIDNTNSCEYHRAGNEQTTGRQRVGIPLNLRCQNRQTAQPTSGASGQVP